MDDSRSASSRVRSCIRRRLCGSPAPPDQRPPKVWIPCQLHALSALRFERNAPAHAHQPSIVSMCPCQFDQAASALQSIRSRRAPAGVRHRPDGPRHATCRGYGGNLERLCRDQSPWLFDPAVRYCFSVLGMTDALRDYFVTEAALRLPLRPATLDATPDALCLAPLSAAPWNITPA